MIAFELSTEDGPLCTAGDASSGQAPLSLIITNAWNREETGGSDLGSFVIKVHGHRPGEAGPENLTWRPPHRLQLGDELRIRIVEVEEVDAPTEAKPSRKASDVHPRCSFCGATKEEARGMAYGREAAICPDCVERQAEALSRLREH